MFIPAKRVECTLTVTRRTLFVTIYYIGECHCSSRIVALHFLNRSSFNGNFYLILYLFVIYIFH